MCDLEGDPLGGTVATLEGIKVDCSAGDRLGFSVGTELFVGKIEGAELAEGD